MMREDVEQVTAIDRLSFSLPWPARAFDFELGNNVPGKPGRSMQWVAEISSLEESGKIRKTLIGMIVIWFIIDEVHIATIAVHPDYRRKGVARSLVSQAFLQAEELGFDRMTLEVRASNIGAQELYKQFGFRSSGLRRRYYKDNQEDAIIMTIENFIEGGKN